MISLTRGECSLKIPINTHEQVTLVYRSNNKYIQFNVVNTHKYPCFVTLVTIVIESKISYLNTQIYLPC
jgi:hypothetical protein